MIVKANTVCFIDGHRRRAGEEFVYNGKLASYMEIVDAGEGAETPDPVDDHRSDDDIKRILGDVGVRFHPNTGREKLIKLLKEVEGK